VVVFLHPLLRRAFDVLYSSSKNPSQTPFDKPVNGLGSSPGPDLSKSNYRLNKRISFDVCFSLVFLIALHGFSAAKILAILFTNFCLATRLKKEIVPVATWTFNIGILFANVLGRGYPYAAIANIISPLAASPELSEKTESVDNWGSYLDGCGGLVPRWEVLFNVTVLRLISFNLDYYWSTGRSGSSPLEVSLNCKLVFYCFILICTRRSSSIQQTSQSGTVWTCLQIITIIPSATT